MVTTAGDLEVTYDALSYRPRIIIDIVSLIPRQQIYNIRLLCTS